MERPGKEPVSDVWVTKSPEDPYFDSSLNTWILTRYRDVAAALREPRLIPVSASSTTAAVPVDSAVHAEFRAQALRALAPVRVRQLEAQFAPMATRMAAELPTCRPVDLVEEYAKPWSLEVARIAADVPAGQCARLSGLARSVFDAACEPYDPALETASQGATAELGRFFHGAPPLSMQMFIALAHTLPCFLGAAWLALLQHPARLAFLRQEPALLPKAVEELLRLAGPARAQFRQAIANVTISGCTIRQYQRVILMLDIANRDPEQFPDPSELQFDGRPGDHLALGTGLHACVGAVLIRSAAAVATKALIDCCSLPERYTALPASCFAVRYLKSLFVLLQPAPAAGRDKPDDMPAR
jgi:cytochrome P450